MSLKSKILGITMAVGMVMTSVVGVNAQTRYTGHTYKKVYTHKVNYKKSYKRVTYKPKVVKKVAKNGIYAESIVNNRAVKKSTPTVNHGGYSQNNVTVISGLSEAQIKALLPERMKELSTALYNIEHSSKPINALFLMSIAKLESGSGTSYLYRVNNNIGGVKSGSGFRKFSSKQECLYYMQDFLYRGYINQGRKTPWTIGAKYCVGGNWGTVVNNFAMDSMRKSFNLN